MSATTSMNKDVSPGIRRREHVHRDSVPATQKRPIHHRTAHLLVYSPPLLLAALLLLAWYALTVGGLVPSLLLPTPGDVFASLFSNLGILWSSLLITVQESVFGFLLALAIALPLGYGIAKSRLLALTLQPYVSAGQAIPALVIAPLLFIWLGYVMTANILVCTLVVFFPVVVNTILGMRTIDPALTDAARVEGAAGWSLLAHIEFPLALPAILAAVRTGFTLSIVGATVAEFVNVNVPGLGALLVEAKNQYDVPLMFASILVLAMLAALYYALTGLLVRVAEAIY